MVSASLDSARLLIGDQTTLRLSASLPDGYDITFPSFDQKEIAGLEVISVGKMDTLITGPEKLLKQNITLAAFDSGFYKIPELPFAVIRNGSEPEIYYANSLAIEVMTLEVDSTRIAPIKSIIKEPYKLEDALPFIYGLAGILLFSALVFFLYKKLKKPEVQEVKAPIQLPAHVIALSRLEMLEQEKLWQKGEIKAYQSSLTHIIREYIESKFNTPALESTTDEILKALRDLDFSGEEKSKLREMLQLADMVKFAKAEPPAESHQKVMANAVEFVEATMFLGEEKDEEEE